YGTPFSGVPDPRDAVIYQVNIRAFSSTRNLQGVINRLDNIKALGVNVIYLMPIYPVGTLNAFNSPYCIKDFTTVGSEYGSLNDLRALVDGAHSRGMAVILDWVANQTSWDHPWITQHPDWYQRDANGNIKNLNGWTDVAALDHNNANLRAAMIEAMRYWIFAANIDGYRFDYANNPNILPYWSSYLSNLRGITTHKLLLLAEGDDTQHYTRGFDYIFGDQFYYNTLKPIYLNGSSATLIDNSNSIEYTNASSNQAVVRYITNHDVYSNEGSPYNFLGGKAGVLAAMVVTSYMKSIPFIYNGMEVGNTVNIPFPFNTTVINWSQDPSVTTEMTKIINLRNTSTTLRRGILTSYTNSDICAFKKVNGSETFFVMVNLRNANKTFTLPSEFANKTLTDAYTNSNVSLGTSISLSAYQYRVFKSGTASAVSVTSVSVSPSSASLFVGQTLLLTATISPSNATNQNVTWSSSNNAIATVSSTGLVTANAAGTATITVRTEDGNKTATSTITVSNPTSFKVYFYRPTNWGSFIRIYYWNTIPSGSMANVSWPGVAMKAESKGWYSFTFTNVSSTNLIFTDGTNQTADLTRNTTGWYKDNTWYNSEPSVPSIVYYRIKNRWQSTQYLYDGGDQLKYGVFPSTNNFAYQWILNDVGQQNGYVSLKNRQTGEFIHIENLQDYVQCSAAGTDWWSAQWILEPTGDGWLRIRNRWQTNDLIHLENLKGYAQHAGAQTGWHSAMWQFEAVASSNSDATSIKNKQSSKWAVYPNIVESGTKIRIEGKLENVFLKFYDLSGRIVLFAGAHEFMKINLNSGIYFVHISDGNQTEIIKIIVK
ncbi:MAG: alpha-amylase family glycosyl hydrolase, partial [Bacteroidales bacterium]|nr:alpha-amylase family glycosyl hydrolase [Bacteroidales bacterium]